MDKVPFTSGAYAARSPIAGSQRSVNLYGESNPKDSPWPYTFYPRPGLVQKVASLGQVVRRIFTASNGVSYCVVDQKVFVINANWTTTQLGTLNAVRSTPVSISDNGVYLVIVDGSTQGYTIKLADNSFALLTDSTGTFVGADVVDFIDTFFLFNKPGTNVFYSTIASALSGGYPTFDATYQAAKNGWVDNLVWLIVNRHEILLLGAKRSESWYDAGNAGFPFAEMPGQYIEHGLAAQYSVAAIDISVFWLSQDVNGDGVVLRQKGYDVKKVSDFALDDTIRKIKESVGISDAIGFCFQQDGHAFYVLTFPTGNQTWVFDDATEMWHQWGWTDPATGLMGRHRANCFAVVNGLLTVGDYSNGKLYAMSMNAYTDAGDPMLCIKSSARITSALNERLGQIVPSNGQMIEFRRLVADVETGQVPLDSKGNKAGLNLRVSDDHGQSWGDFVVQTLGGIGEHGLQPLWIGLGQARYRCFEISWACNGRVALNGLWVDAVLRQN